MKKCPNCSKLYDENLIACPSCKTVTSEDDIEETIVNLEKKLRPYLYRRIWKRLRFRILGGLSLMSILGILGIGIMLYQAYVKSTDYLTKYLTERIQEKFKTPRIRKTVEQAAKVQSEELMKENLLPIIKDFQQDTNKKVDNFNSYIENLKKEYDINFQSLKIEIAYLAQRNSILKLADRAVLPNGANAYKKLCEIPLNEDLSGDLKELAVSQMYRVVSYYLSVDWTKNTNLEVLDPEGIKRINDNLTTDEIINFLQHVDFRYRAKAARLLANRKEKKVPHILFDRILNDTDLSVVKRANMSFCEITGFISGWLPKFPVEKHIRWWSENKEAVLKNLK